MNVRLRSTSARAAWCYAPIARERIRRKGFGEIHDKYPSRENGDFPFALVDFLLRWRFSVTTRAERAFFNRCLWVDGRARPDIHLRPGARRWRPGARSLPTQRPSGVARERRRPRRHPLENAARASPSPSAQEESILSPSFATFVCV